jgi:hypothetical protein
MIIWTVEMGGKRREKAEIWKVETCPVKHQMQASRAKEITNAKLKN